MDNLPVDTQEVTKSSFFNSYKVLFLVFIIGFIIFFLKFTHNTNEPTIIHISQGETVNEIINDLESKNITHSKYIFKIFLKLLKSDKQIERGDYLFPKDVSVFNVAWMLASGTHNTEPIKITFREGINNTEIVTILSDKLPNFQKDVFLSDKNTRQGYLFPDTYFLFSLTTPDEIVNIMSNNFNTRISPFKKDILNSSHSLNEIIVMASIIEKEAQGKEDSHIISGILWKRIKLGMPLQVDAAKVTYNTKGLPIEPISNPGIITINAAINPTDSPYLFYLHDKRGQVHFAKTFTEHKRNISLYLK